MILGRGEATRGREGVVDEEDRVGKEGRKEGRPELGSLRHGKSALTEATGTNGLNFIFCNTLAVPQPVLGHPRTCDLFHRAVSLANAIQPARHYYYASALISSSLFSMLEKIIFVLWTDNGKEVYFYLFLRDENQKVVVANAR